MMLLLNDLTILSQAFLFSMFIIAKIIMMHALYVFILASPVLNSFLRMYITPVPHIDPAYWQAAYPVQWLLVDQSYQTK